MQTPGEHAGTGIQPVDLKAISEALSIYAEAAGTVLEQAPVVRRGDSVWIVDGDRAHRGLVADPDASAPDRQGLVEVRYVHHADLIQEHTRSGRDLPALTAAAREGRSTIAVRSVIVPRDQVLKTTDQANNDRVHLEEQRRSERRRQARERRLDKAAAGPLTIGRIFPDGEIAGRALARHLGLEHGLADWLWRGADPISPGYARLAAELSVTHQLLTHPKPDDYRYQLVRLPDADELATALVSSPTWARRTRHVRKLAECGTPGTELLVDHHDGTTEILVSDGVALNPIELWASVPDNDMIYGLRIRRANGESVMLNPTLLFSTLVPRATAEHSWWVLNADGVVADGPFGSEIQARARATRLPSEASVRHGHPAMQHPIAAAS